MQITAKVAQILSNKELVITAGSQDGVKEGLTFKVMGEIVIKDPDTSEILDEIPVVKVKVKVTTVRPKISIAETLTRFSNPDIQAIMNSSLTYQETFDYHDQDNIEEINSIVYVGDPVYSVKSSKETA